jgi:GNAT superfamily N-acetyltransferase
MFIRSERLFLRPGWPEDWQDISAQMADDDIAQHLPLLPRPDALHAAQSLAGMGQGRHYPHFLITLPGADGARVIGCVGLSQTATGVELGYWIGPDHWGRGYATEASRAVLRLARTLGHRNLEAMHFVDNPASGQVLHKIGFVPTGQTVQRYSAARGGMASALVYGLSLGQPSDCDGGDDAGGAMRAA